MVDDLRYEKEDLLIEDYEPQLWSCVNCFCGECIEACPAYRELKNEAVTARGLAEIGLAIVSKELKLEDVSDNIIYTCTGCRWCEKICSMNYPIYILENGTRATKVSGATISEILRSKKVENGGKIPKEIRDTLNNISKFGNPYGGSRKKKDLWAESLNVESKNFKTILYFGSTVPYNEKSTEMAEAIVNVLRAGEINFGILGRNEKDSGTFARMLGDEGLYEELSEYHEKNFIDNKVDKIICISPHDYDVFKNQYKNINNIEIEHYTQTISKLIVENKIKLKKEINKRITYHDPCYLGRQNDIYDQPRIILNSIPGIDLVEMDRSRAETYCCGGGGAGLFMNFENVNMDMQRAKQINEVSVDCVAVACPNCYQMIDAAIKSCNYNIDVKDIAQIVNDAL